VAAITKGLHGEQLCDYVALKEAGAVAVSDDGKPVSNAEVFKNALIKASQAGLPVISHCEDLAVKGDGIMNKGSVSKYLKVPGIDRLSEDSITERDVRLAEETGTSVHIAHVSTEGSIRIIKEAKARGVKVTCETCPHYFMLTDIELLQCDADYKMNPPLRESKDREAVCAAILDGTVDCIVTDHAPHAPYEKENFMTAAFGTVGLETALAATLKAFYHTGKLSLQRIAELMAYNPRKILNLPLPYIKEGERANIVLADLNKHWTVDPEDFKSKSRNSAFKGMKMPGKVQLTVF
jgi:dihydroorotase